MATPKQKLEEEKKQLGLEQDALEREKNAIKAAQLGSRRAALGRSSEEKIGRMGGGALLSTPLQRQQAKDIGFVEQNIRTAEKILQMAESDASQKQYGTAFNWILRDRLAEEKKQVASARADIQRVNRGERPLLAAIKLPEKPKNTGPISFGR